MTVAANLGARLERILDARRIVTAEEELQAFAVDGVVPAAIVRPASAEEVAEVVRFAQSENLAVIPSGSRSKLEIGMPPLRYDIAIDTNQLQQIAHFDAGDMTLSVDAGMPLRTLEGTLAAKQQFLPLAVPCYETSTVGGAISSGIDSVLRQQYGTARDFLIGAEFVDGTGKLCKSGGRVVKNVTGYDMHKLLIGSLGTLGVITRLNFRTFPLAQTSGGYLASFASSEQALACRASLESSGLPFTNIEVLSPEILSIISAILRSAGTEMPPTLESQGWCVYLSYEGNLAVVQRVTNSAANIALATGAAQSLPLETQFDESLGGMLREAYEWLRWASPSVLLFRIVQPQIGKDDLAELANLASVSSLRSALLVRAAGVLYFAVLSEAEDMAAQEALEKVAASVFAHIGKQQGHATLLHAPELLKFRVNVWGPKRVDFEMMRRVKQAFDPQAIFAPGRFVGGL